MNDFIFIPSGGTPIFTMSDTIINSIMAICIGYLIALAIHSDRRSDDEDRPAQKKPQWPDHG